jgi:outer membrane protein TolC
VISSEHEDFILPKEIDLCMALTEAESNRPEMNAALFKITALHNQINQNKAAYGPKIVAQGWYGRCDDDFYPQDPDWSVGVSFELPLFEGYGTRHRVGKAEAELRKAIAEYDNLLLAVKQNVWNAYSNLLESYESIQATMMQVNDAQESLRLIRERYKVGASIVTDLLDVETAFTSSQANLIDAHWRYHSAYRLFLWAQGK